MLFFSRSKILMIFGAVVVGLLLLVIPDLLQEKMSKTYPSISEKPINLEKDSRGGMEMVLEVDPASLNNQILINERVAINNSFRRAADRPRIEFVRTDNGTILVRTRSKEDADKAMPLLEALSRPINSNWFGSDKTTRVERETDRNIRVAVTAEKLENIVKTSVGRSIEMFRCRIDPNGTHDLNFVLEGDKRFLMQIPAVQEIGEVLPRHSGYYYNTNLSFHIVNEQSSMSEQAMSVATKPPYRAGPGERFYPFAVSKGQNRGLIVTERTRIMGDCLKSFSEVPASKNRDAVIGFSFDAVCSEKFGSMTAQNIGKRYAVVLDGEIIAAPTIRSAVSDGKGFLEANFTDRSAEDLECRVKAAGSLPVRLTIVEERVFPPS